MRFLVTGGAGFIGSNIVEALLKEGHFVRVLDNFHTGKRENLSFVKDLVPKGPGPELFELIEGDIRDKSACDNACAGIDYVFHQAALRSVPGSIKDPDSYNAVNIQGTLNMLQAALKNKVKRFVFASSSSIYGDTDKFPQRETDLPRLISPYALSKLTGEYYCRIFSEIHGLETVCLRYFNVFGPRQALDDEYAVVIPKFIHCILNNQQPPIFGDGRQSRDFVYIENVVQANLLAATSPLSTPHLVLNVASGKDTTILELVRLINEITGKGIPPLFLAKRPGDVYKTIADISAIKKALGKGPQISFKEGLRRTIEFWKEAPQK